MENERKGGNLSAPTAMLLILTPIIGIGGTAIVSYFRLFSLREIYINIIVSAALCILSEISVRLSSVEREGAVYFVLSYISGLVLALLSPFTFECFLPLAAPAVIIAFLAGPFAGASALILFSGISFILLYESGLYIFYIVFSGFVLIIVFAMQKKSSSLIAVITCFSLSALFYTYCIMLSGISISPEIVFFPALGVFFNILIIMIVKPKIYENVIYKKEIFYNKVIDPEYELLKTLKNDNRREYDVLIHTAHFCDMLSEKLKADRRKCLGICYYSNIGILDPESDKEMSERSLDMIIKRDFPPDVITGIKEYFKIDDLRLSKESALVYIIRKIITGIYEYIDKNDGKRPDYNAFVGSIMREVTTDPRILTSDLSLYDLNQISEKLRSEVLYYDFLL